MHIPGRLFKPGETVLTDWAPSGGDNLIVRVQQMNYDSSSTGEQTLLTVKVRTKNRDDAGDGGTPVTGTITIDGNSGNTGKVYSMFLNGSLKELYRYEVSCVDKWVVARILAPVFTVDADGSVFA